MLLAAVPVSQGPVSMSGTKQMLGINCVNEFQSFLTKPASGRFSSLNPKIVTGPLEALPKEATLHIESTAVMNGQSAKDF